MMCDGFDLVHGVCILLTIIKNVSIVGDAEHELCMNHE